MKLNTIIAALAVAATSVAAVPAVAQSVSQGDAQLASTLGVEPGAFSRSDLILLQQAQSESGAAARSNALAILNSKGEARVSTSNALNRAILLDQAREEHDDFLISQRSKDVGNNTADDRASLSPGKVQLAATLDVNPADYTTAELVVLQTREIFADNSK